ncbi:hypothetical protein PC116_g17799 [Phytophthora cactorum]|uniref:Uncharacterized protein n=1 Tax=Phytophthora cactorum TaxID=29920 RepID=A0A8T1BSV9_9STRA|nr:hypothetical protein Pcac1_g11540 [Phytophthora cactorum]KAG2813480.1 hypothetical protein PC111_g14377 [Phytophthora cactorum]KAG2891320.1 hypothetical protein PC114_g17055 [Phytophthora cactorum]KAG2907921.1 hypothetical protein PC115_g13715 [Phytophthora cactorum]KAG2971861.1 hypothetical protein PC118_g16043 [Phytophthora cactorum]
MTGAKFAWVQVFRGIHTLARFTQASTPLVGNPARKGPMLGATSGSSCSI